MNAQTLSAVEYVEEGPMPPYPIYIIEFEDYDEVERLKAALRKAQFEDLTLECHPELERLAVALEAMTPQVTL